MLSLAFRRLCAAVPTLLVVCVSCFLLIRLSPGSPFASEKALDPNVRTALAARYGLDRPLHQQLGSYLRGLGRGDLGPSIKYPEHSVSELIGQAWPHTALLAVCALTWALLLGCGLALSMALWPGQWPATIGGNAAGILLGTPSFVLGPLLVLAAAGPRSGLPVAGWGEPRHLVLPSLTLGTVLAAGFAKVLASGWRQTLRQDFVRTARAKGLSPLRVMLVHALWGGMGPWLAMLGPAAAGLLAGSVAVEQIFNVPGLGPYFVDAAQNRDYFLLLGIVLIDAALLILMNLFCDLALLWCDPRLRDRHTRPL